MIFFQEQPEKAISKKATFSITPDTLQNIKEVRMLSHRENNPHVINLFIHSEVHGAKFLCAWAA
jgi:hypothetical protein